MKTIAYIRVSTGSQDLDNQKLAILDYARRKKFRIDDFVERQASSRKTSEERGLAALMNQLETNDRLIVNELSRLGRSLGQIIQTIDELVTRKVHFVAIKESIEFNGKRDIQTKVMVAKIGLFAEIERDLISQRTKGGLASAKAKGKILGRPKGSAGKSKLNGRETEIRELLDKEVSKAAIARIMGVSRTALHHFIQSRNLVN